MAANLHPRNKHRDDYDFDLLTKACPDLKKYVFENKHKKQSIDFSKAEAVKLLNIALLKAHYAIENFDIPDTYLCPAVPGRADHIHHIADFLATQNKGKIPRRSKFKCLDVGTGSNLIYPIIGNHSYNWRFVGTDIDEVALKNAAAIIENNPTLGNKISLRHQKSDKNILRGIWTVNDYFDLVICNPPFYPSLEEALKETKRKNKNLHGKKNATEAKNFGGQLRELSCEGGELQFVETLIKESKFFMRSCYWFTSLVSKESHVEFLQDKLRKASVTQQAVVEINHGNKKTRVLCWTFLTEKQAKIWKQERWHDQSDKYIPQ